MGSLVSKEEQAREMADFVSQRLRDGLTDGWPIKEACLYADKWGKPRIVLACLGGQSIDRIVNEMWEAVFHDEMQQHALIALGIDRSGYTPVDLQK
jgi:hypothetical protein